MTIRTFNKDGIIFRQGDAANGMYDIHSGSVGVYIDYGKESEKQLTTLQAGDYLGEMGLIEAYPRSATAVALEDGTQLQEIGEREFSDYFKGQPERLLAIMRQLSQRLRDRTEDYETACRVLEELQATQGAPGGRSGTLLEKVKQLMAFYDSVMSAYGETDFEARYPGEQYFF